MVIFPGVELKDVLAGRRDPLGRNGDKAEDKFFEPKRRLQPPDALRVGANNVAVKISHNRGQNHEDGIFRQERAGQFFPSEIVTHLVKQALGRPPLRLARI